MTSPIDDLLARARLHRRPYTQAAIDAAAARLSVRAATRPDTPGSTLARATHGPTPAHGTPGQTPSASPAPPAPPGQAPPTDESSAADNLQTLCETVITHTDALTDLEEFLARALPEPPGARVLGCMLQLCAREESARMWWQYAAGAGDTAASYCLYLHHRALGEHGVADWWQTQHARYARSVQPGIADLRGEYPQSDGLQGETPQGENPHDQNTVAADASIRIDDRIDDRVNDRSDDSGPEPGPEPEDEISTTLRVLRALKPDTSPVPDPVNAVLHYIPAAVAYVDDDLDLPLPDPDFTDRIRALATPVPAVQDTPQRSHKLDPLPSRRRAHDPARNHARNPAHDTAESSTVTGRPAFHVKHGRRPT
ncbi:MULTISPECIES: hypothetical protein [unclassified Streptomyces]|uniref:hypothetical protein n=1 Tax=unclassified Streptomyces TaxID=2593676 RepID=UPI0023661573|nr:MULTISPECIES: hypothetical protein [unclassified Streptomyces]MDF3142377.1 hypothetical protein [Streptomyces sp. T21Q-yed]WDF39640.1 hypothetical protein PBV52_23970 [Streptomyces sp. T12]